MDIILSSTSRDFKSTNSDEVKAFLKIKKVEFSDDKPYYKLHENKQTFTLFDSIRKIDSDKSIIFEHDKIFTNEENSYIYEEICRDTITEALKGKSFGFVSYGLSHSGKKSTMFGGQDCITNINNRGIFFRLLENLITQINKTNDLSLNISYVTIFEKKYLDLSPLIGAEISNYDENQLLNLYKKHNPTTELINIIRKVPVTNNISEIIHFYSKLML